jgi:hypothetical protein
MEFRKASAPWRTAQRRLVGDYWRVEWNAVSGWRSGANSNRHLPRRSIDGANCHR